MVIQVIPVMLIYAFYVSEIKDRTGSVAQGSTRLIADLLVYQNTFTLVRFREELAMQGTNCVFTLSFIDRKSVV